MSSRSFVPASKEPGVFNTSGPYVGLAVLMAVTAWVYWKSLAAPFHFDDGLFLQSARVTDPRAWLSNLDPTRLRQFTYLTFHWNYRLGGTEPAGYHAANVGIHLCNVLLLFIVARLFFGKHKAAASDATVRWLPLAAAGIFGLHPVQSEPVNYVYQRCVLLAGLFALMAMWALATPAQGRKRRILVWGAALSWSLAMASKESAVVLPLVVVAYLWSFAPGRRIFLKSLMERHRAILIMVVAAAACAGSMLVILGRRGESTVGFPLVTNAWSYPLAQIQVFAVYLRLLLWPRGLTLEHAFRPAPVLSVFGAWSALLFFAVVVGAVRLRSKDPVASFFVAAFLILLLPTSSIVPSADLMFEHRLYLPMIAGSCLAAWGGWRACSSWAGTPGRIGACAVAMAVLLAACAGLSRNRTSIWSDDLALWQDAVLKAPWSPRAHYNLAVATLSTDRNAARSEFLSTIRLQPANAAALYNLGWLEQTSGRFDDACACYFRALAVDPSFWQAHQNLGNLLVLQGRFDEAEAHYASVIRCKPDYSPAYLSLATLQIKRGGPAAALATLDRLRMAGPEPLDAFILKADALIDSGSSSDAERELSSLESMDSAGTYRFPIGNLRERIRHLGASHRSVERCLVRE